MIVTSDYKSNVMSILNAKNANTSKNINEILDKGMSSCQARCLTCSCCSKCCGK